MAIFKFGGGSAAGTPTPGGNPFGALSNDSIPRFNTDTRQLEDSGFRINPLTRAIEGAANIETTGVVQAGVDGFRLNLAHIMRAAAENVTFRNLVTGNTFHPTWQTTDRSGTWQSVQRTPIGPLVEDQVFQSVRTATVTNPRFEFTSLAFTHRLYEIDVEPLANTEGVVVVIERQNGQGVFVDYWRSGSFNLIGSAAGTPTQQTVVINPFIDLMASTVYRLRTISTGDVQLRGNAAGVPRILLTYRRWEDRPLATLAETMLTGVQIRTLLNSLSGISLQTTDQSEVTNTISNLTLDRFPVATNAGVGNSRMRLAVGEVFVPGLPSVEATGVDIGETLRLSESAGALSAMNTIDNLHRTLIDFLAPTNAASSRPRRLALTGPERQLDIQANVSDPLPGRQLRGTYRIPQRGRINAIRLFSQTAIFGLRMEITSGFDAVKYIPSREAWLDNTGLDFSPGGELDIRIDGSPLFSERNGDLIVSIRTNAGVMLGTTAAGPAFVVRIQDGEFIESADQGDIVRTFLGLTDTPAAVLDGQFLRAQVTADGTTLQAVRDPSRWDHRAAPTAGTLSVDHHVWWENTTDGTRTITLPTLTANDEGWDMLWENFRTTGDVFLNGPFGGTVNQLLVTGNESVVVGWNGTAFRVGPRS